MHPIAWWLWAFGLAIATTQFSDAAPVALLVAAIVTVVALCHEATPWARAFPAYLLLGAIIVSVRVVFYVLVGVKGGGEPVVALPRIPLPGWAGGIELLGPVTVQGLAAAASAGLSLAALVLCFGAAVALTNPKRALRSLPASLHELGTAAVVAVTLAPQLVQSWQRVRRAQGLRGERARGIRSVIPTLVPVLQDALDRALALAASMDSRGYARVRGGSHRIVLVFMTLALVGAALGSYALLDASAPPWLGLPVLAAAAMAAAVGSTIASRRVRRTTYRPDRWRVPESVIAVCGAAVAVAAVASNGLGQHATAVFWALALSCGIIAVLPALVARVQR